MTGRSGAALLDSYASERVPLADRLLHTTDRMFAIVLAYRGLAGMLRNRVLPRALAFAMTRSRTRLLAFRTISHRHPLSAQPAVADAARARSKRAARRRSLPVAAARARAAACCSRRHTSVIVCRMRARVKICCIASVAEARLAIRHGADAVGLVSEMPSGPGVIPEARIAEIAASIPPGVASFLLTSRQSLAAIVDQQRRLRPNTLQICDRLPAGAHAELRQALPGIGLVQVVHVTGEESVAEAVAIAPHVDALLLDSGNQALAVKQLGGTGRQHDWGISRRVRAAVGVPVYLAGGLRPDNVAAALHAVEPFGVDVCSGVRTDGRLDARKLAGFLGAVRSATTATDADEAPDTTRR